MPYVRKTRDEYQVHVNYGYGFEEVTCADNEKEGRQLLRDYRQNEPQYPSILVKRRIRLEGTATEAVL